MRRCVVRARLALSALGTIGALAAAWFVAAPAGASSLDATTAAGTVTVTAAAGRPGDRIGVVLSGWPTGAVLVDVCTASAPVGDPGGCAAEHGTSIATVAGRSASGTLVLAAPPLGCPCEVRAGLADATAHRLPGASVAVALTGAPVGQADEPALDRPVTLDSVTITGRSTPSSWFGGSERRTLVVRIRNRSDQEVADVSLAVSAGPRDAARRAIDAPAIEPLAAGEARSLRVPVTFDGPVVGEQVVEVRLAGATRSTTRTATLISHPWGVAVAAGGVVVLLAVRLVRLRRRVRVSAAASSTSADREKP